MAEATTTPSTTPEPAPERYEELVQRLARIVERLEGGGLSLEESITAFEEGMKLARAGSARLDEAERRVEILLENDRTQPFEPSRVESSGSATRRTDGPAGGAMGG